MISWRIFPIFVIRKRFLKIRNLRSSIAFLIILVNKRYEKNLSFFKIWAQRFSWILMPNVKFKCWMDSIVLTQYFSDPFYFSILIQGHICLDKSYWALEKSRTRWEKFWLYFQTFNLQIYFSGESQYLFKIEPWWVSASVGKYQTLHLGYWFGFVLSKQSSAF